MRRMQLMEQKQQLFSPTSEGSPPFVAFSNTSAAVGDGAAGTDSGATARTAVGKNQREEWRRNLRSRGGVQ